MSERYEFIEVRYANTVLTIAFNRPEVRNALNHRVVEEVITALDRMEPDTRLLVLRGASEVAFAAGADIGELEARDMWTDLPMGIRRELAERLERAPCPTLAAIDGLALGGGLELAMACHLRVASDRAKLGLPESRLGIIPGNGGTVRLPRLVGPSRALAMMLFAQTVDSKEAHRIGLVDWVFPADSFDQHLKDLQNRFIALPRVATEALVECVYRGIDMTREQALSLEHRWFQICLASPEKLEGVAAFLDKRKPHFPIEFPTIQRNRLR